VSEHFIGANGLLNSIDDEMLTLRQMTKYVVRTCPKCGDFFGVILGKPSHESKSFPIQGWCMRCGYQLDWKLILGSGPSRKRYSSFESEPIRDA
jgi:hypothetical protein